MRFVIMGVALACLAGCASQQEKLDDWQKDQADTHSRVYGKAAGEVRESGIAFQRFLNDSSARLTDDRTADKAWARYRRARDKWAASDYKSGVFDFPAEPLYNSSVAYFSAMGQMGRVITILQHAVADADRLGNMVQWRIYQLKLANAALRVGNRPLALASVDAVIERYGFDRKPLDSMSVSDRALMTLLLSRRYAALPAHRIDAEKFRREAAFVLSTVAADNQFRLPQRERGIPAVQLLSPLMKKAAALADTSMYTRLHDRVVHFAMQVAGVTPDDLNYLGDSIYNDFTFGNDLLALMAEGDTEQRPYILRFKPWTAFDTALDRWESARALGRTERRSDAYRDLRDAYAELEKWYATLGERLGKLDGMPRAEHELLLVRGQEAEISGDLARASEYYRRVVAWSERVRASLAPELRLYFFQGFAKPAYLGSIRTAARRAEDGGDIDRLLAAIQRYRGRQLQEQMKGEAQLQAVNMDALQAGIGPDELRLIVLDLESTWLTMTVTRDRFALHFNDDAERVRRLARTVREGLLAGTHVGERETLLRELLGDRVSWLDDVERIGALTDGLVSLVPLEALRVDGEPLVRRHRIRYFPVLAGGRDTGGSIDRLRSSLVVADPQYMEPPGQGDRKLASAPGQVRSLRAANAGGYFTPLPETRDEAKAVVASLDRVDDRTLFGANATEPNVDDALATGPDIIHFATHGILGGELAGLDEAALVLSPTEASDGLLTSSEIAGRSLDARLAVLSACNTGNGDRIAGEGLIGVSRAFLGSGVDVVVASLWPVDSQATVRLMTAFYERLGRGLSPEAALQEAKNALRTAHENEAGDTRALIRKGSREPTDDSAYFWSPFILVTMPG